MPGDAVEAIIMNRTKAGVTRTPSAAPAAAADILGLLRRDIERTQSFLPEPLWPLAQMAWNYSATWLPDGPETFAEIDASLWQAARRNPRRVLEGASPDRLAQLAVDPRFLARVERLHGRFRHYMNGGPAHPAPLGVSETHPIAYFCAEFGVHESLPLYSGGLGILAGDHLKSASDRGLPLVAVGLRYRQGYFHQRLDLSGWQTETYADTDFGTLPVGLALNPNTTPVTINVSIRGRNVTAQLWVAAIGRVPLILLDADRDDNNPVDRWITGHLYGGGRDTRLAQEMMLGIGGVRALRALGLAPSVFHLNEGHSAFLSLELAREQVATGKPFREAAADVREQCVFTTHTPVAAGHDAFDSAQMDAFFTGFWSELRISHEEFLALGRRHRGDHWEEFGLTPLALRMARSTNGVARKHGEVCRAMWQCLYPGRPADEVPIAHVTNGVHHRTWIAPALRALFDEYLGEDWEARAAEPQTWQAIDRIPDEALWEAHQALKARLITEVRRRSARDRAMIGEPSEFVAAAERLLDPNALTLGFARRVATYKRLNLLLADPPRALGLLNHPKRRVQLVIAGKGHPGDSEAKHVLQSFFAWKYDPRVVGKTAFLMDYDAEIARLMVQGVDVWINIPRRPMEASGTSGMKAAMNGVLNCSVLDGWWIEGYDGENGWAVGPEEESPDPQRADEEDARALYDIIEKQIVPLFYDQDKNGIPRRWVARMRHAIKTITPAFTTDRMVGEYAERIYATPTPLELGVRGGERRPLKKRITRR
jgi:starch phosphorylase